ncbi:hypothetical protein [Pseudorhodoferax sp. Leaf265]|uniref:hypothetical protein n=1 Tax=Pseudorhodoferax sp. Leaf265 TaxID=1736315 RepID=UPI0006F4C696|nr:hypothetical protein [Pseudorhodoferax sp. Leaf265]KQP19426.1 hypothetical protein ASF45_23870 [Pseudorhodoferax sp. Leaf265]
MLRANGSSSATAAGPVLGDDFVFPQKHVVQRERTAGLGRVVFHGRVALGDAGLLGPEQHEGKLPRPLEQNRNGHHEPIVLQIGQDREAA